MIDQEKTNALKPAPSRECGMLTVVGSQGFGKSVETKKQICRYVSDILGVKKGRKVLILDTQGEYNSSQFGIDGIPKCVIKNIAVKDVRAWCFSNAPAEVRRIDLSSLHIDDKLKVLNYVMQSVRNLLIILEDINKITLTMSHLKDVVSSLIGLRHAGVDVVVSFQSLRAVEPRVYDNSQYVRLHYVSGSVSAVSDKVGEPEAFSIAQLIIKRRVNVVTQAHKKGSISEKDYKRLRAFFVIIYTKPFRIEGAFTLQEFKDACAKYLAINGKRIREDMSINDNSKEAATQNQIIELVNEYYGNSDGEK